MQLKKLGALLFFLPAFGQAVAPVVTPSTPIVTVGGTLQFSCPDAGTWTLTAGSLGSINSGGLYTAPTTHFTAKNVSASGCPFRPNDAVVNTRIDALPVDSHSAARIQNLFTVIGSSAKVIIQANMPTNIYNSGTPLQSMNFRSTSGANGLFPLLSSSTRMEEGSSIANDPTNNGEDHHILGVDSNTCQASEMYGYYPTGADSGAPLSNAGSGFQYFTNWYRLPDVSSGAGGVDAAGMPVQELLLRKPELDSGQINHALRMTLDNGNLFGTGACPSGALWPATDCTSECQNSNICFPYGSRIRLRASYNCAAFPHPGSQAICVALQQYGAIFVDGGSVFAISANYNLMESTANFQATVGDFQTGTSSISDSDFEQVDESSLMISSFTENVNPANGFVTPSNFAQVIFTRTSDAAVSSTTIAIQPVTVGWANPAYSGLDHGVNVMARTPQFQIPFWVAGATDTTATCSMTPAVGILTSDCLYTAPASQYNSIQITTVTVTSNIDPGHASSSFFMTVFSTDAIRIREGPAVSGADSKPPYLNNGNYQDPVTGNIYFEEPVNNFPNWFQRSTQGSASWPNQLYNNFSYNTGDEVFSAMVPAGNYTLQMNSGSNASADVLTSSNSIETQGVIFQSTISLAPALLVPRVITTTVTVDSSHKFYWAIRHNVLGNHNFLSYWSLTLSTTPVPSITSPNSASATVGQPFSYQITATNSPTSFDAPGLPFNISVNTVTGLISGTPLSVFTSSATISATNAGGTGTAALTITSSPAPPPSTIPIQIQGNVQSTGNIQWIGQ